MAHGVWDFPNIGVPYLGVIRVLLFRVLYIRVPYFRKLPYQFFQEMNPMDYCQRAIGVAFEQARAERSLSRCNVP